MMFQTILLYSLRRQCRSGIPMTDISLKRLEALMTRDLRGATTEPKYVVLFQAFTEAIRRGDFKPGQRIPAESELCSRLPVSLGTLQKAMGKLAENGLIVRNRRTGTFVADRRSQASEAFVYRFRDPVTGQIQLPFVRVLAVEEDRSRGPWRSMLKVERCVRLDRLLWIENDPPAFTSVYFAFEHGKALLDVPLEELHGSSTHRVMVDRFNLPTVRVEHRIGCRPLSAQACEHLRIADGTSGTVWDVSDFSIDDRPILFQRLQLPPGHRPIEIQESFAALKSGGGGAPRDPGRTRP
jgi:GntR family transcriptional regulator